MNIVADTSFAFTAPSILPNPALPKSSSQNQLPLAGPGLAGGGVAGLPAPTSAAQPAATSSETVDGRPLIDRAMELVREVLQSALNQLFELLQSGIAQLVDSLLTKRSSVTSTASPVSSVQSAADSSAATTSSAPAAEKIGSWIDGAATAANVFVLGRGVLGIAGRIKGTVINGAKSVASLFEKAAVSPDLLRTLGTRIKSALL